MNILLYWDYLFMDQLGDYNINTYTHIHMHAHGLQHILPTHTDTNPLPILQTLTQTKFIVQCQLQNQLILNRILLSRSLKMGENMLDFGMIGSVKLEEGCCKDEVKVQMPFLDATQERKTSKKISHNSSQRNDTKNIPKNYGKAILNFIHKSPKTKKLTSILSVSYSQVMSQIRKIKKNINTIQGLRQMWGSQWLSNDSAEYSSMVAKGCEKVTKCIRIMSHEFMRKYGFKYIFKSRVRNYAAHVKYRRKIIQGIQDPAGFKHIKDY